MKKVPTYTTLKKSTHLNKSVSLIIFLTIKISCRKTQTNQTYYCTNILVLTTKVFIGNLNKICVEKKITNNSCKVDIKKIKTKEKFTKNKQKQSSTLVKKNYVETVIQNPKISNFSFSEILSNHYPTINNQQTRFISNLLIKKIEHKYLKILIKLGNLGNELGYNIYAVGGFVRDLFLNRKNKDIDIVVEGNGIVLAKKYAKKNSVKVCVYKKFCTASIKISDDIKIDIASSRIEYYKFPATLSIVKMSPIKLDFLRRDFTINTLLIQLNPGKFGRLISFSTGQKDIKTKTIRVLHNMSLIEDPIRILRALRFEQRFGFKIEKTTSSLINNAIKMNLLRKLSNQRVFAELKLALMEKDPCSIIMKLFDYGLLKGIFSEQENRNSLKSIITMTKSAIDQHKFNCDKSFEQWAVYFMVIIRNLSKNKSYQLCENIIFPKKYMTMFCTTRFDVIKKIQKIEKKQNLSYKKIFIILSKLEIELILYITILTKSKKIKKIISEYQKRFPNIHLEILDKKQVTIS